MTDKANDEATNEIKDDAVVEEPKDVVAEEPKQIVDDSANEAKYYKLELEKVKQELIDIKSDKESKSAAKNNKLEEGEIKRLREELDTLKSRDITNKKKSILEQEASKQGIKQNYIEKLEKFIDFNDIPLDNEFAPEIVIKNLKSEMPDLFGAAASASVTVPDISLDGSGYSTEDFVAKKAAQFYIDRNFKAITELERKHKININKMKEYFHEIRK